MKKNKRNKKYSGRLACENGISFRTDIAFSLEQPVSGAYFSFFQLMITVAAAMSTVFMAISFLESELPYLNSLSLVTVIFLTALAVLFFSQKNTLLKVIAALYLVLNTAYVLFYIKSTVDGLLYVIYAYTKKAGMSQPFFTGLINDSSRYSVDMFFFALTFLLTLGISLACIYRTNFPLLFLFTFPIFELGAFWGWEPDSWTVAVMIICWVTMLTLNTLNHTTKNKNSLNTFAIYHRKKTFFLTSEPVKKRFFSLLSFYELLVCTAIFIAAALAASSLRSFRPEGLDRLRRDLSNGFQSFTSQLSDRVNIGSDSYPGRGKMIGGINGGRLGLYDEISFRGITALSVRTDYLDVPMYLRGYVAGSYSDNTWSPVDIERSYGEEFEDNGAIPADYGYLNIGENFYTYFVSVRAVNANKDLIYSPYQTHYSLCENVEKQEFDGMADPENENDMYTLTCALPLGSDWEEIIDNAGADGRGDYGNYQSYVNESTTYLATPAELTPLLDEILAGAEGLDINDAAEYIRDYFEDNGFYYTLEPGITPADEDFVEYFLTEQKKGYCTYYASAGVMLMRRLGYPARYVEGYIVEPEQQNPDGGFISVLDRSAHAWCEVYVDGSGWYPLEFTPGYEDGNPNLPDSQPAQQDEQSSVTEDSSQSRIEPDESSSQASSSREQTDSSRAQNPENSGSRSAADTSAQYSENGSEASGEAAATASGTASGGASGAGGAGGTGEGRSVDMQKVVFVAFTLLFILIAVLAIVVQRKVTLDRLAKSINCADSSEAVLACYRHCLRFFELFGIGNNQNITDTKIAADISTQLIDFAPSLAEPFNALSELAITAYMSEGKITPEDAHRARELHQVICTTLSEKMTFAKRLSAKWLHGLC